MVLYTWKGKKKLLVKIHGNRRMIEKIRLLTACISPGGGGHGVALKGMKKIHVSYRVIKE